ncbi:hypothetical protein QBC46DRAFT_447426 [Diplogelasinospora grovesii]|uniref:Uncharacterized protein n=1 Tax=Diplogelasinospora grovesii TaxID=303347 RepID=A0AAN6NFP5_9PEZI|nr:hypothetical protein QBC46DRAFT_447426 [Diplogelasinospora grovesii]
MRDDGGLETYSSSATQTYQSVPVRFYTATDGYRRCLSRSSEPRRLTYICRRVNSWAYVSGFVVILAHMHVSPTHGDVKRDRVLASYALTILQKMTDATVLVSFRRPHQVVVELDRRARTAVEQAEKRRLTGGQFLSRIQVTAEAEDIPTHQFPVKGNSIWIADDVIFDVGGLTSPFYLDNLTSV